MTPTAELLAGFSGYGVTMRLNNGSLFANGNKEAIASVSKAIRENKQAIIGHLNVIATAAEFGLDADRTLAVYVDDLADMATMPDDQRRAVVGEYADRIWQYEKM